MQTISQLGQETRTGTTVLFASQAFPDEEELCLRSVGAPVMEVSIIFKSPRVWSPNPAKSAVQTPLMVCSHV